MSCVNHLLLGPSVALLNCELVGLLPERVAEAVHGWPIIAMSKVSQGAAGRGCGFLCHDGIWINLKLFFSDFY